MSKIGSSKHQFIKNHLWEVWYWTSLFKQFHQRSPNACDLKHLNKILKSRHLKGFIEWAHVYEYVFSHNMNIKLWNKHSPSYHDDNYYYIVNHKTSMIYIIDKLKTLNIPNEALKEGYYTIYKNKFTFQQYIDNKIKRKQTPGSQHLVGRSCNPSQRIYVKEIATKFTKVVTWDKKAFAQYINSRSNNLPHYYDSVRGHKGYWISLNPNASIFHQPCLPKYAHYTKKSKRK